MPIALKAEFTVLLDYDGYWLVEKSIAVDVIAAPERYRDGAVYIGSKIAACRLALERAAAMGATELHIDGLATAAVAKEIRARGLKPFIYRWNGVADLTRNARRKPKHWSTGGGSSWTKLT